MLCRQPQTFGGFKISAGAAGFSAVLPHGAVGGSPSTMQAGAGPCARLVMGFGAGPGTSMGQESMAQGKALLGTEPKLWG